MPLVARDDEIGAGGDCAREHVIVVRIGRNDARRGEGDTVMASRPYSAMACSTDERCAAKREAKCGRASTSRSSSSSAGEVASSISPSIAAWIS